MTDQNVVHITAHRGSEPPERLLWPSPDAPLEVARKLYEKFQTPAGRTAVSHRGDWLRWNGQQWEAWDSAALLAEVYRRLGEVDYDRPIRKGGEIIDYERAPWNPNRNKVANVLEALAAVAHLGADIDAPAWIGRDDTGAPADRMIACTNGLLSLTDRTLHSHTPAFYNHVSVPFPYQPQAPKPTAWLEFLDSVWPDDPASIELLQEWIGYIVTGRTDMQKILLLIGPTRSGKGTIGRTLRNLIGRGHVTGPTLASLGTNFGLAPLMGKPLAIIADARLSGRDIHTIVERLLSISGEDVLTIDRKFRDPWSGKLGTRIMILSNEIPRFSDASGAVANRLLVLQMRNSFLGKEDRTLDARITAELPSILNWALAGLDRLASKGRFTVPKSSGEATTMLMDLASPVSAFVRDCCVRSDHASVERDRLYGAWKRWCLDNGHEAGSQATFGRNLAAAVPDLGSSRPRINGKPIRYYTRIGVLAGSPGSLDETCRSKHENGTPVPGSEPGSPEIPLFHDPRTDPRTGAANVQVNASDPRDPRNSALPPVLEIDQQSPRPKTSCRVWFESYVANALQAGHERLDPLAVAAAGAAEGYSKQSVQTAASAHPGISFLRTGKTTIWSLTGERNITVGDVVARYLDALPANLTEIDQTGYYAFTDRHGITRETARKTIVRSGRIDSIPAHGEAKAERRWIITPGATGEGGFDLHRRGLEPPPR